MGNPVVKQIKYYRKTVIASIPNLKYLDDRPVFDDERRRVNKWKEVYDATSDYEQANEAERNEIKVMREEKKAQEEANFRAFDAMVQAGIRTKAERAAAEAASRKAYALANGEEYDEFKDAEAAAVVLSNEGLPVTVVPEHPTLKAKREVRKAAALNGESGDLAAAVQSGSSSSSSAGVISSESNNTSSNSGSSSGGFFAVGATPDGPDPLQDERAARDAKNAEAQAKLRSLLAGDIWPELSSSSGASALPDMQAMPPPPPTSASTPALPPPPPAAPAPAPAATMPPMPPPPRPTATSEMALPPPPPPTDGANTDFDELD
jgi:dynein assembly factor 1